MEIPGRPQGAELRKPKLRAKECPKLQDWEADVQKLYRTIMMKPDFPEKFGQWITQSNLSSTDPADRVFQGAMF